MGICRIWVNLKKIGSFLLSEVESEISLLNNDAVFFFSSSFVWGREGNVKDTARSHSKWRLFWKRKIILWRVTHGNVCARVCPSSWMNCTRRNGCNEWKLGLPSMKSAEQNEAIKKEKVSLEIFVNFYDFSLIKKRLFSEKCICPTVCFK